ncbi:MAG: hypothetical protein A2Y40_05555 [Candidatus Margulisbacteria bacterium GWF2_35_9]|nr:MAG: hypothetical protein A2Y40_05555 [Candidatus Margulisbacteria bacterium GWF2_35_9]
MKKFLWISGLLILGLIIGFILINSSGKYEKMYDENTTPKATKLDKINEKSESTGDIKKIPVKIKIIEATQFTAKLKTVGTTFAKDDYILSAKMNGEITYLNADIGTVVKKNDVLAKIDPEMAEANYNQAAANYNLAQKTYSRQKILAEKKLVSTQQLDGAEAQYQIAKAALSLAKINLNNSKVLSPIDGVIAEKFVNLHTFSGIGTPVARVVNIKKIQMEVGVSEQNIVLIKKGNKAFIKISSYPGEVFQGYIVNMGLQADKDNKSFPVTIEFDNIDGKIKGGMIADISILLNTYSEAIVVSFHLLQQTTGGYYLYIVENDKAVRRDVVVANIQDDVARISDGLAVGDHLVIEGHKYINDQVTVTIEK